MMENTYGVEEPKLLSTSSPVVSSGMIVLEGQASCVAEYIVRRRAVLRKSHNLSSEKLGELSVGEIVAVTHKVGNRMRCHRLSWRQDSGSVTVGWASECLDDGQGEYGRYISSAAKCNLVSLQFTVRVRCCAIVIGESACVRNVAS